MSYRIAINGFGRIGRCVLRAFYEANQNQDLQIVAVNDLADINTIAHLTRYDSTHGRFAGTVTVEGQELVINGDRIRVLNEPQIDRLPWNEMNVDLVMECTGSFSDRNTAVKHLQAGANKVLFSQPGETDVDATIVFGINHQTIRPGDTIISNASCSTNCIVPVIDCLDRNFTIDSGLITTIHSAMNDQPVIDAYHHSDLRKNRSAVQSIIPVDTGIARGISRIFPHLQDRFEGQAMRVPTVNVSAIDMAVLLEKSCTVSDINDAIKVAGAQLPDNVLGYTDEPLASCDFNHDPRSAVVDLSQTRVVRDRMVKVLVWFDNEWAYANRMLDVSNYLYSFEKSGQ